MKSGELEKRITARLDEALALIGVENHPGYPRGLESEFPQCDHRWQLIELCRDRIEGSIRSIAALEIDPATPNQEKTIAESALSEMKMVLAALAKVPWSLQRREQGDALVVEQKELVQALETLASGIPSKRTGGSRENRLRAARKEWAIRYAFNLMYTFGIRSLDSSKKRNSTADLATLLYQVATGSGDRVRHAEVVSGKLEFLGNTKKQKKSKPEKVPPWIEQLVADDEEWAQRWLEPKPEDCVQPRKGAALARLAEEAGEGSH